MGAPRTKRRDFNEDDEPIRPRRKKRGGPPLWVWLAGGGVVLFMLCGCCGVGGWVAWSAMAGSGPVTAANYNRLKKGMSQAEVHAILGPPTRTGSLKPAFLSPSDSRALFESWKNGADFITVDFENGKATSRSCDIQHNGAVQLQDSGLLPW